MISKTPPELAYQIFLTSEIVDESLRYLQGKRKRTFAKYAWMTIFALVVKALGCAERPWKTSRFTDLLEHQWLDRERWQSCYKLWDELVEGTIEFVQPIYAKASETYKTTGDEELTLANFFKNVGYVNRVLQKPLPATLIRKARKILDNTDKQ